MLAKCLLECHKNSVVAGSPLALKVFVSGRGRLENEGSTALAEAFKVCCFCTTLSGEKFISIHTENFTVFCFCFLGDGDSWRVTDATEWNFAPGHHCIGWRFGYQQKPENFEHERQHFHRSWGQSHGEGICVSLSPERAEHISVRLYNASWFQVDLEWIIHLRRPNLNRRNVYLFLNCSVRLWTFLQALPNLQKLEVLNFGDCLLRTKGAEAIADAIKDSHASLKVETLLLVLHKTFCKSETLTNRPFSMQIGHPTLGYLCAKLLGLFGRTTCCRILGNFGSLVLKLVWIALSFRERFHCSEF